MGTEIIMNNVCDCHNRNIDIRLEQCGNALICYVHVAGLDNLIFDKLYSACKQSDALPLCFAGSNNHYAKDSYREYVR